MLKKRLAKKFKYGKSKKSVYLFHMRKDNRCPWILPYEKRKLTSKKFRDTEKEIKTLKQEGKWYEAGKLSSLLRRAWWGVKRYK